MKHRIFTLMLALILLLGVIPATATETTEPTQPERDPGYCGEAIVWTFSGGTLTITGAGRMDDFPNGAPWEAHKSEIETVIISGGITYVGAYSFNDYDRLTNVQFGNDVAEIGERGFFSCDGLTAVYLPRSFICFGPMSFMGCTNLKEFHCEGVFPHFRLNCMWDTYATIYYPAERPWPLDEIINLEEAFHGRIEFLASDGSDPYDSEAAPVEPPPTGEAPGDVPTEAPTEAPTTAPTTEPTTAPTEATTEATTEAPTTVPPTTEAPTEEVTEPGTTGTEAPTTEPVEETHTSAGSEPAPEPQTPGGRRVLPIIVCSLAATIFIGCILFLFIALSRREKGRFERRRG